jgi:hypothetical protein
MNSKKGQVTIFVIIGILLLASVGFFLYTYNTSTEKQLENLSDVKEVTTEIAPIKSYVEQCMSSISEEAIRRLGQHGGYMFPTSNLFQYQSIDVRNNDGVPFNEEFIPYWSYSSSTDNIYFEQELRIPTIEFMEYQTEIYVEQMLPLCLDNFESLQYQNTLNVTDAPDVTVKFGEEKILIRLDMLVEIENTNDEVKEFYTELNIPFKKYYDVASVIAYGHQQGMFVENILLYLIGYYGYPDMNSLPPMFATEQSYVPKIWSQNAVNQKLKGLMQSYVQILRIKGSKNSLQLNLDDVDEIDRTIFLSSQMDLIKPEYIDNSEISFIYNDFPIYSRVYGKKANNAIIKPESESNDPIMGAPTTTQIYKFFYDVTMPVVVEMRYDPLIEGQKPFVFMFSIEANIRKNLRWTDSLGENGPMMWDEDWVQTDTSSLDLETFDEETQQMVPVYKPAKILFGDVYQRLGNLSVKVYDEDTLEEIEGVGISVGIGDYAATFLGHTQNQSNGEIKFNGNSPLVNSGYLSLEKSGYANQKIKLDVKLDEPEVVFIKMSRIVNKNIFVKIFDLQTNTIRELMPNESVMINIDRINEADKIVDFSKMVYVDNSTNNQTLELIPGTYEMTATLIDNSGVIIPPRCKKIKTEDNTFTSDEYVYIPEEPIIIKPAIWGGFEFDVNNSVIISKGKVYENNKLEFIVVKDKTTGICIDDLEKIGNYNELTKRFRSTIIPKFN